MDPQELERKKAALEQIKKLLQDPEVQHNLEHGQMFGSGTNLNQAYQQMGVSGAPLSQQQGIGQAFSPANSTYQGEGGPASQKMGINPGLGQPSLNRVGGPLDVTPSGVAAGLTEGYLDPRFRMHGIAGAGVKSISNNFPELSKLITSNPNQKMWLKDQALNNPDVENVLKRLAPGEEAELAKSKNIIEEGKLANDEPTLPGKK